MRIKEGYDRIVSSDNIYKNFASRYKEGMPKKLSRLLRSILGNVARNAMH